MGDRSGVQKFTASKVGGIVLIVSGLAVAVYGIAEQADLGQDTDVAKAIIPTSLRAERSGCQRLGPLSGQQRLLNLCQGFRRR